MKAIYDNAWHHPFVAYVVGLWLLFELVRRLPFLYGYTVFFLVDILADACATGGWSPVPPGTTEYTFFSVLFIVLGDFRYFLLVERVTRPERSLREVLAFAAPISLFVPITTGVMTHTIPAMQDDRVLYVVYECALCVIVLGIDRFRLARSGASEAIRSWVHSVSLLFAGLYFGWAFCDVLIFNGVELGHVLRIIPNVLYYGAFLPFVFFTAPPEMRAIETPRTA